MRLIEFIKIGTYLTEGNHSLDMVLFNFYVHSPVCKTGHGTVVLQADLVEHKLHELVFYACAFCIGSHELALRRMDTFFLKLCLVCGVAVGKV